MGATRAGLLRALAEETIHHVYSSDLSRAHATARAIAQHSGEPTARKVQLHTGLRERGFGTFEGQTWADIETHWPEASRRWRQRDPDFSPTGGESLLQLRARVVGTAERLAARHPGELIALVGHGGVMDVLYRAATRLEVDAPRTWALGNTAINRLLWSPEGFALVGWGDTRHLSDDALDESTSDLLSGAPGPFPNGAG